ncbi:hypothetical protein PR202_ga10136 [Eleusine coracana subsp. coracana]|uniref:Uncharacterized protein n=1 Tax=Eleusine coracana subsp. coracana TaxID=191504 RepID=A0AAV5C5X7_ELECO|nr:hypothetical protein PR202_ga10136 [Eleusine coracana subsp. coracana]
MRNANHVRPCSSTSYYMSYTDNTPNTNASAMSILVDEIRERAAGRALARFRKQETNALKLMQFCAERKKAKLKLDTHFIWEAFLEANVTNKDKKSVCDITNKWYFGEVKTKGRRLVNDTASILRLTAVMCFVDLNKLVETCRNDEIESLVKKKYGQEAYVIFRLLVKHGCPIETDQVKSFRRNWKHILLCVENKKYTSGKVHRSSLYHAALNLRQMVNNMVELQLEVSTEGSQT